MNSSAGGRQGRSKGGEHAGFWSEMADYWRGRPLASLCQAAPQWARACRAELAGLRVDWSRQYLDEESRTRLLEHARTCGFHRQRDALFAGERVNASEQRAAMHMALRGSEGRAWQAGGEDASAHVREELTRIQAFVEGIHAGELRGHDGRPFRHVVNIGIGGSHLGPEVLVKALPAAASAPELRFLSNVDPAQGERMLAGLDPAETLFLIVSKTFTSKETMENAAMAREWIAGALGEDAIPAHFAAVSAAPERVTAFGIDEARCFRFWDWVGGRFSVWSAAGLAAALHLGMPAFRELLAGAAEVDEHFESSPDEHNLPLLLGLLDVQSVCAFGWPAWALVPYADRLRLLPAYFQQLVMESNGKGVGIDGEALHTATAPVLLGGVGTDAQHAFFQMLHQGPVPVPVDFIAVARPEQDEPGSWHRHRILLANCLAQGEALCHGRAPGEVEAALKDQGLAPEEIARLAPQKSFPGNRPSTLILMERLAPRSLGALIALYEHRVFVQACLWGINPFDQMGVELGKQLAGRMEGLLAGAEPEGAVDATALAAVEWLRARWPG